LAVANVAVIVPVPLIVAVVLAELGLPMFIEPVSLQAENEYPLLGVATIEREPAFSHTVEPEVTADPPAVMEPPEDGESVNVTLY
jgi:hypothetical protein